ncbi:hypothetical protein EYF80_007666 [Liparis tanakae]|uniref:Uncharacterized protein n=1 Tax=Liparis tanakae TaxID=230148 RepID=A0A4Z2IVN5_9TELE|nr:hypothetical protein EYF80_007666 [Liparis tanakae]
MASLSLRESQVLHKQQQSRELPEVCYPAAQIYSSVDPAASFLLIYLVNKGPEWRDHRARHIAGGKELSHWTASSQPDQSTGEPSHAGPGCLKEAGAEWGVELGLIRPSHAPCAQHPASCTALPPL